MRKLIFLVFILLLSCFSMGQAQNAIAVQKTDGSVQSFDLQSNGSLYFVTDSLMIRDNNGVESSFLISEVQKIYFASSSSIAEVSNATEDNIFLYPNPAKNYVKIANLSSKSRVQIFSLDGRKLYNNEAFLGSSIDISSLREGIYIMRVNGKTLKFSKL